MGESVAHLEQLERRIEELRAELRRAATSGDRARSHGLREELRRAQSAWDQALTEVESRVSPTEPEASTRRSPSLVPIREQVHQVLTLLSVPAAPRLVIEVHRAFFAGEIIGARLTSLRRDEERSFGSAPFARPYYICAALTADLLAPARGLLAVSTWPMARRIVGPLSPRVNFLTAAITVAEHIARLAETRPDATGPPHANRLLWRFAANIPGAAAGFDPRMPTVIAESARAELQIHHDIDQAHREEAAERARAQLSDTEQLFGTQLRAISRTADGP